MARLQELLGHSLTQSLGLQDALRQREAETQSLVRQREMQGQLQAEGIRQARQPDRDWETLT